MDSSTVAATVWNALPYKARAVAVIDTSRSSFGEVGEEDGVAGRD